MVHLDVKKTLPWILYLIFFAVLNETVFGVSAPAIRAQFALTSTGVSWMTTMFILFFGVSTIVFGRLSDLFSIRTLLSIGIVVYALGSLVGFLGQASYPVVLLGRALQGIGGSALPALVMVIVARYFAPEVRGALFGSVGSVVSFAAGIGPVIGGFVSSHTHWSWLFLIPLLTLIAFPFIRSVLPREERRPGHLDVWGAAALVAGLGSLIVWLTDPSPVWLIVGVALVPLFIWRIRTAREPFVDPQLFRIRPYRAGVITTFVIFGTFIGLNVLLPLSWARQLGLDEQTIGLVLFPGAISGVFLGPFAGRLADKHGNPRVLWWGWGFLTAGLAVIAALVGQPAWAWAVALVPVFAGITFFNTGLINGVSQTLPENETGVGMGAFNLVGFLAGAVGGAVVGRLLDVPGLSEAWTLGGMAVLVALGGLWYIRASRPTP